MNGWYLLCKPETKIVAYKKDEDTKGDKLRFTTEFNDEFLRDLRMKF